MEEYQISTLGDDLTKIISCRSGDIFVWLRDTGNLFSTKTSYGLKDMCVMPSGSAVKITNRFEDLPCHIYIPLNKIVGHKNVNFLLSKLDNEYQKRTNQISLEEVPSWWRIKPSDYLIWVGEARSDESCIRGILKIFSFTAGYLFINETELIGLDAKIEVDLMKASITK